MKEIDFRKHEARLYPGEIEAQITEISITDSFMQGSGKDESENFLQISD